MVLDLAVADPALVLLRVHRGRTRARCRPLVGAGPAATAVAGRRLGALAPLGRVTPRARTGVWLGVVALGLLSVPGYAFDLRAATGLAVNGMTWYVALFAGQFALYLAASWLVLKWGARDRAVLVLVLGFGLLFRLAVLPTPIRLSSDPYRYLWDGRVQHAGISPYRYAPAAPELRHLRDEVIHPNINRPTKRTIYPPGAEMLFALVAAVAPDSLFGWRLFLLGCE